MPYIDPALKASAHSFLEALRSRLNAKLLPPDQMLPKVRQKCAEAKDGTTRLPERVFFYKFLIPEVFEEMQSVGGIDKEAAKKGLLCEGYTILPQYCSGTPARTKPHPFTKIIGADKGEIFRKWANPKGRPFTLPNPDFAFRDPFPFKIVFECKYFEVGTVNKAARELVGDIYQAFFYRSLPFVPANNSGVAWDYDFACLLAYDASPSASLRTAWDEFCDAVKDGFWDGANVYVMVLRPGE